MIVSVQQLNLYVPVIPITYDCVCVKRGCECIEIGDGLGEFTTLALCQENCGVLKKKFN